MQRAIAIVVTTAAVAIIVLVIATTWKHGEQSANGTPPPHAIDQ
jgi:hypothetical protein